MQATALFLSDTGRRGGGEWTLITRSGKTGRIIQHHKLGQINATIPQSAALVMAKTLVPQVTDWTAVAA